MAESAELGQLFAGVLNAARNGESTAFEYLYRSFAGRIRAFAIARSADDPDGVTNDVFLRAFQNLGSFDGDEAAFVRWLFTIARNRLIDLHRAAQRQPQVADEVVPERPVPSAETQALDGAGAQRVARLLEVLTPEQREVIALRMVDDLSITDVAEIVDRPITAVKALQRRGLRRLEKEILERGVS